MAAMDTDCFGWRPSDRRVVVCRARALGRGFELLWTRDLKSLGPCTIERTNTNQTVNTGSGHQEEEEAGGREDKATIPAKGAHQ